MKYNLPLAITAKLINCFIFAVMTFLTLYSSDNLPIEQVLFMRASIGILIAFSYLKIIKQPITFNIDKKNLAFYATRSVISFVAMVIWIKAIKSVGVTEATAISYTGPFWLFIAAKFIVGEALNIKSLLAIFINMIGVFIILHPSFGHISIPGIAASLVSILLWVLYETICKKQTTDQHYMVQSFYVYLFSIFVIAPFALSNWQTVNEHIFWPVFTIAALSVINLTSIFIAYKYAPMMVISPFSYARLLFTAIFTNIFYHTMPHIEVFIGAAIVLSANLWFAYHSFKKQELISKEEVAQ